MKPWVVIPAFNEEENIASVIREIKAKGLPLIVVDDGSVDSTSAQVEEEKVDVLINNKTNLGKGASLRAAFDYIKENRLDCDAVIIMDADAQHHSQEIDLFIHRLEEGSALVQGNRLNDPKNMPILRVITNKVMSFIISIYCGQKIPDTQCGFKAIRREVLDKLRLKTSKYEIESELLIQSAALGYRIDSVAIKSIYRKERSNIDPFIDTARFIKFILSAR
jgi:glycosyltransferase involved in cell wall biosynthesis